MHLSGMSSSISTTLFSSAAGWFQVQCSSCTAALQVRLPEGITKVRCDLCRAIFQVKVAAHDLPVRAPSAPRRAPRKKRKLPAGLEAYNCWKKGELKRLRSAEPGLPFSAFNARLAAAWKSAAANPKNGGGDRAAAPAPTAAPAPAQTAVPTPALRPTPTPTLNPNVCSFCHATDRLFEGRPTGSKLHKCKKRGCVYLWHDACLGEFAGDDESKMCRMHASHMATPG